MGRCAISTQGEGKAGKESDDPVPLSECIQHLLTLLDRGLRPQSRFHIETADRAAAGDIGGELLVSLPRTPGGLAEVRYLGGKFRVVIE